MSTSKYYRLEFTQFPRVWGIINVPENFVVYRSGTRPPMLSKDPRFFSDFPTAKTYEQMMAVNGYKTYGCCLKDVRLMDLRTLRYLFWEYVGYNRLWFDEAELKLVKKAMFALGLMTLDDQWSFIQSKGDEHPGLQGWSDKFSSVEEVHYEIECSMGDEPTSVISRDGTLQHYTNYGNRISETSIDDEVVALLKAIFGDTIDGYIAPTFDTVWHDFRFNPELCLFNPSASIKFCTEVPAHLVNPDSIVPPIDITLVIAGLFKTVAGTDLIKGGGISDGSGRACKMRSNEVLPDKDSNFANEKDTSKIADKIEKIWKVKMVKEEDSLTEVPLKNIYKNASVSRNASSSRSERVERLSNSLNTF